MTEDINVVAAIVRYETALYRRKNKSKYKRRKSKLDRHATAIYELHREGLSYRQIAYALKHHLKPSVKCSHSTVERFIKADHVKSIEALS